MLRFEVLTVSENVGVNLGLKKGDKFVNIPDFNCSSYIKTNEDNQDYFIVPDFLVAKVFDKLMFNYYEGYGIEETVKNAYDVIKLGYADTIIVPEKISSPMQSFSITVIKYLDEKYGDEKRKEFLELWKNSEFYYIPYISLYKISSLPFTFYEDKGLYKFNERYEIFNVYGFKDPFNLKYLLGDKNILYFDNLESAKKELEVVKDICYSYYERMRNSDFKGLKQICEEVENKYGVDSFYTKYVYFVFSELYLSDRYHKDIMDFDFNITGIFRLYTVVKHKR